MANQRLKELDFDEDNLNSAGKSVPPDARRHSTRPHVNAQRDLSEAFADTEVGEQLATRMAADFGLCVRVMQTIGEQLKGDAGAIEKVLKAVPGSAIASLLTALTDAPPAVAERTPVTPTLEEKRTAARSCLESMLENAISRLKRLQAEQLKSNCFEEKWGKLEFKDLQQECICRGIAIGGSKDDLVRRFCVENRVKILDSCTIAQVKSCLEDIGFNQKLPRLRKDLSITAANALCDWNGKKPFHHTGSTIIESPLPTFDYLDGLFKSNEKLMKEFNRLSACIKDSTAGDEKRAAKLFRAVAFARLHGWFMAASDAKNPFDKVGSMWAKVPCFKDQTVRKHWLGVGRLVWRYPILAFQDVLKNLKGKNGWMFKKNWTPKLFEQEFDEEKQHNDKARLQDRFDSEKLRYYDIIYPMGFDIPTIRSIPVRLRALGSHSSMFYGSFAYGWEQPPKSYKFMHSR